MNKKQWPMPRHQRSVGLSRRISRGLIWLLVPLLILSSALPCAAAVPEDAGAWPSIGQPVPATAGVVDLDIDALRARPRHPELDATMAQVADAALASKAQALALAEANALTLSQERVLAQLVTDAEHVGAAASAIQAIGGEVTGQAFEDTLLQAWLPTAAIAGLAAEESIFYIRQPQQVHPLDDLDIGASTTEGVAAMNAAAWHTEGLSGAGIKIGIIDVGFQGYPALLGADLPITMTMSNFCDGQSFADLDGTSPHGTACAEIVYDVAPNASLHLAKISTSLDLAEAVTWLKDVIGVDVISTSVGWYNVTPGDGTGEFADLVQSARAAGIFWATSAGNDAENHWGGPYVPSLSDPNVHTFNGPNQLENWFGPGDPLFWTFVPAGYPVMAYLRWDDWMAVDQDFDLLLLKDSGGSWNWVSISDNPQSGGIGQSPTEFVYDANASGGYYAVSILRYSASRNVQFELFTPKMPGLTWREAARSLANLADAPDAITVAAIDVTSPYPKESYSSEGPTNGPGGTALGGLVKPNISGFANVATESYPASTFNGTSSACPHVAGAAALVLSGFPGYTPSQIQTYLEGQAIDQGTIGYDTLFGAGRLYLGLPPTAATLTPTPSNTPSFTPTRTHTATPTGTSTPTSTTVPSNTPTSTITLTPTAGPSLTSTATASLTPTGTLPVGPTLTPTQVPTLPSLTPTSTATKTPSITKTATITKTPTPTKTPTATKTPPCIEGLLNGGFELNSDWTMPATAYSARYTTDLAFSGLRSLQVGIIAPVDNVYSYSDAHQTVDIPADATTVTLRFKMYPVSGDAGPVPTPYPRPQLADLDGQPQYDVQYLLILNKYGRWIDTLFWEATDTQQWALREYDLSNYAGQTIKLNFGAYNTGWGGVTGAYIDNASLEICTHAVPTPSPKLFLPLVFKVRP